MGILTIVPMASRTGSSAGQLARRSGAAVFMARDAQARAMDALQRFRLPHLTIAMRVSQIGWRVGALPRRIGAAGTLARVALQWLEGAHEHWLLAVLPT